MRVTPKVVVLLVLFALALAGCQPIQPVAPQAGAAPMPELVEKTFPTSGITVSLPEGAWLYRYEPRFTAVLVFSEAPPADPQSTHGHWEYLMEEPIIEISLINEPYYDTPAAELGDLLTRRFGSNSSSEDAINPEGRTTVVEEPALVEINGQPAAKMIVTGTDVVLDRPFNAHVWGVRNGDRVVWISCALVPKNEAAFVPLLEKIAETVFVSPPEHEPPLEIEVTGEIAVGETITSTSRLSLPDKVVRDFWHFTGKAGTSYRITVTPLDPFSDIIGNVVDANGQTKVGAEQDNTGDGSPEVFGLLVKVDADYYIVVRHFFLDPGPYTVKLESFE